MIRIYSQSSFEKRNIPLLPSHKEWISSNQKATEKEEEELVASPSSTSCYVCCSTQGIFHSKKTAVGSYHQTQRPALKWASSFLFLIFKRRRAKCSKEIHLFYLLLLLCCFCSLMTSCSESFHLLIIPLWECVCLFFLLFVCCRRRRHWQQQQQQQQRH